MTEDEMIQAQQASAFISAQTALLNCRVAGMIAENQQRQALGQSMAFTDQDFFAVEREFEPVIGFNAIVKLYKE